MTKPMKYCTENPENVSKVSYAGLAAIDMMFSGQITLEEADRATLCVSRASKTLSRELDARIVNARLRPESTSETQKIESA